MDSFGILSGLLGGLISSGAYEFQVAAISSTAPFNSSKDIVIVLATIMYSYTPYEGAGWMAVYGTAWEVPNDGRVYRPFKTFGATITDRQITTTEKIPFGIIVITKA